MVRWAVMMIAACGAPSAPASSPSNHVTAPPEKLQRIETAVLQEYGTCKAPAVHHVELRVDGQIRGTITVPCDPPPVPHNGVIVITSDEPHMTNGPVLELGPGYHNIEALDVETKLHDAQAAQFPYNVANNSAHPDVGAPADLYLVTVHDDWLRSLLAVKANLIIL